MDVGAVSTFGFDLSVGAALSVAVTVTAGLVVAYLVVRVRHLAQRQSSAPSGASGSTLSVIIPARNEAEALPELLADLQGQTEGSVEIVVVDDESTDDTAELARDAGAKVVSAEGRPSGWNPKVWALDVGVGASTGSLLTFLDADVRLGPSAVAQLRAEVDRLGGLVSAAPFHRPGSFIESASALCNVMMVAGGGPGFGRSARGAVGSCIVMSRTDYEQVGGHRADRATIVDDLALAARTRAAGLPTNLFRGGDVVAVRSYPDGLGAISRGWIKNLAAGMTYTQPLVGLTLSVWLATNVAPWWNLARGEVALGLLGYGIVAAMTWWLCRQVGRFNPAVTSLGAPALAIYVTLLTVVSVARAALGKPTKWKDRPLLASGLEP